MTILRMTEQVRGWGKWDVPVLVGWEWKWWLAYGIAAWSSEDENQTILISQRAF